MDMSHQTSSPLPRLKLTRRNPLKNYDYTTPCSSFPSRSSSSSNTSTLSPPRTGAMDLSHSSERIFRISGKDDQLDQVWKRLGLSGPEEFEIPKEQWEAFKSVSDLFQLPKRSLFDEDKAEQHQIEEISISTVKESDGCRCSVDCYTTTENQEVDSVVDQVVMPVRTLKSNVSGGIKGCRPPLLTPPPAMSLCWIDSGCSTWDLLKGLGPEDIGVTDLYPPSHFPSEDEADEDVDNHDELVQITLPSSVGRSESCSLNSSLEVEDDSSSTTTDISPTVKMVPANITFWEKGCLLGRGSFGTVYEGITCDGMFFAIKEVSLLGQGSQARASILSLQKEIEMLSQLKHENIVQYLGAERDEKNLYIFLELVTKGSLACLYETYHLRDTTVAAYTRQILSGLKYLHSKNIVHRDIKCANILIDSTGTVKLSDFGLAIKVPRLNRLNSCRGTALWMAPEVIKQTKEGYGTAADIWGLGCTVLEMSTGQLPYHPLSALEAVYKIGKGELPPIPDYMSTDLRDFIMKCLQVNPNDRPSAAELLDHSFLKRRFSVDLASESPAFCRR